jgi:hypothetical protein
MLKRQLRQATITYRGMKDQYFKGTLKSSVLFICAEIKIIGANVNPSLGICLTPPFDKEGLWKGQVENVLAWICFKHKKDMNICVL